MPNRSPRVRLARPLFLAAIAVTAVMFAYEWLKQSLFPRISIWQSHLATIGFTTVLAVLMAYFLGRRWSLVAQRLQDDMAEHLRISTALELSEARYRHLFEHNKAGVYRTTPEGRWVDCNEAFARMFGYEREDLLKLHPSVLYAGGAQERESRLAELAQTGQVTDYESPFRHKNGSLVWVIQNAVLVKDEGGTLVTQGTMVDVTERLHLEERLRQSEKMEAIGRMAGGIAHDFNNLLTIVLGYSASLQEDLKHNKDASQQVNCIIEAGRRAADLTGQLLAFSRKQVLQPKVININGLVTNIDKMLRRVIGEDIELILKTSPKLRWVKADPGQIEQVVVNLAVNSRDAMPKGGKLTLETANVDLDENYAAAHTGVTPGAYVMLAVSDTGMGMTPEVQAQIFDPFFTTKELGRGTGLGLSTVYGIVQQSGGHIWVYSEVGHGTTFKVYLPETAESPAPAAAEPTTIQTARGSESILLVEDEYQVRELARTILAACGYSVLVPEDPRSALAMAEHHTVHLLLTDVIMPGIHGRELAQQVLERNSAIKVLYMSGYTENTIGEQGTLEPGTHFLQKPFTPADLAHKVREVLDGPAKPGQR